MPKKEGKKRRKQKQKNQGSFHNLQLRTFKSTEEFAKEYEKYDESSARDFYLQILFELEKAITQSNTGNLRKISSSIDDITNVEKNEVLKNFYDDPDNPLKNTNLVILACKHNQIGSLQHVTNDDKNILKNLSIHKGKTVSPHDKDEARHNAFYYAIFSGNVALLEILIEWSKKFFDIYFDELDEILSQAYEELRFKNVSLADEMEIFVENKLVNMRFFSDNFKKKQNTTGDLSNIKKRIELVLENILLLERENSDAEVEEIFLFKIKFIAQNIHILKRQLKSTYDRLPWEEMEFCLICFVACHITQQELNLFYDFTLNKRNILRDLKNFAEKLEETKKYIDSVVTDKKYTKAIKLATLPSLKRETAVKNITENNPQFEDLYRNYHQIRDIYSLEKISSYINLASSVDPRERGGQLTIIRVLQAIGEHLKNTLETPKLSSFTSELLLQSLSKSTRTIVADLRNSLSHASSLQKIRDIEEHSDIKIFIGIQSDIQKIGDTIINILYNSRIKMIKVLFQKIIDSKNFNEIAGIVRVLKNVKIEEIDKENFRMMELEKLENLIKEMSSIIMDKTHFEEEQFTKINYIIDFAKSKFKNLNEGYFLGLLSLKCLETLSREKCIDHNVIRGIKFDANRALQRLSSPIESHDLKKIADLSASIFYSAQSRKQNENDRIKVLFFEIIYITEFQTGDVKWIEEFGCKLTEEGYSMNKNKIYDAGKSEINAHLQLKLSELKNFLTNNSLNDITSENICIYKEDRKLQAVTEMLLLDIMSILDIISKDYLENNLFFLDDNYSLLNGRNLRNHLAHDNILFNILLSNPSIAVILNARKIIDDGITKTVKKIGKIIADEPVKLKEKYYKTLEIITNQSRMYAGLEEGDIESVKDCLTKGADINAKSMNSWGALHFSAKGSSVEAMKFIIEQNEELLKAKDQHGNSPLHVAARYGNANIVKYFVEEASLFVDEINNLYETPLHIAAQMGHKDVVEVLLKNKADSSVKDGRGILPLHHAIRNNHIDTAKILIKSNANVDLNETMGGFTPLHEAAEFGHLEIVIFLLQNKADVNAETDRKWTPLHAAAFNGHLDIVKILIIEGANVNARVIGGCTPLHYALENGHEEIANILLSYGAKVNISDKTYQNTPLHYAAKDGHDNTVKTLMKYGADPNAATVEGITPLHFAAQSGHLEIVSVLLIHGANIHAKDINNATSLHYAADMGHTEVAALLIKKEAKIDAKDKKKFTPLYVAVLKGHTDVVNLLIKNKSNIDDKDNEGNTILHAAAMNGSKDIIDILIKHKAEINVKNNNGMTPLYVAALAGHENAVKFLIEKKAKINAIDNFGLTPLHAAIVGGHRNIVKLLIKNKANINTKGTKRCLHLAVETGHKEIVEDLIACGADVDEKNTENVAPLHTAIKRNYKEIVEILVENGATIDNKNEMHLSLAVIAGYRDILEILIKNKSIADEVDVENATLLHYAAKRGHSEIVKILIKKGINVNAKTTRNVTPLHFAAQEGHEEVVEILIANGANVDVKSNEGITPLHHAAVNGHINVVKILLDKANTNTKDNKNRTALELAVSHGHLQVVKILFQGKKIDINAKGNDDWTLLHIAAQGNNLEIVKYLIDEGADINSKNDCGSKPIHIAAREGFKDAVKYFFSKGCTINDPGALNQTLLHYAILNGNIEMVKYLINEGADVNAKDANGISPMHIAANLGYMDIIKTLLKNGAAYNAVDNFDREPIDFTNKEEISNYLFATKKFFQAVKTNKLSDIKKYIEEAVVVDVKNTDGATPLHFAAWKGYEEVLTILLNNNANPNVVNKKRITPLHYAAQYSHLNIVKILLSHGANFEAVTDGGRTPLDFCTDKSIINLLKLLNDLFKKIKNGNCKVIGELNKIEDINTIKAIMNANNKKKETIIVVAIRNNFTKVEQLKDILQCRTSDAVNTALVFVEKGDYQHALRIFNQLYEKRKYILGPNNPGTLDIEKYVAIVLYKQGNYEEALDKFEEIYQKQTEVLGLNNKDTLNTKSSLALVLHRQGKDKEAYEIYQEVYQKQNEILGSNHPDILDTQFHMALVLSALGKHDEALKINQKLYELKKRKLGANNPATVRAQNNVAMVLANQGKHEESLKIYKEVLQKKKMLFGPCHVDTLRTIQSIASILINQKKNKEALQTLQELLSIQKTILGPNHPETLKSQHNLGNIFFIQGKFANAFKIYTECFEQIRNVFGPTSDIVLDISKKIETTKLRFKIEGSEESEILRYMQDDIKTAIMNGDVSTVLHFLQNKTDANEKDGDGATLLHYAVNYEQIDIVNILIEKGADVFVTTNKGNTPLHTAALKSNKKLIAVLLQHMQHDKLKGFINAKTNSGNTTALHVAANNGPLDIVLLLLKYGAIFNIENNDGKKPKDLSTNPSITNLLELIEELFKDAKNGNTEIIKKLKSITKDEFLAVTNACNNTGNTLYHVAKANKHSKITGTISEILKKWSN